LLSTRPTRRRRRLRAFSLVEIMVVLSLIVVGAGVGTAVVSKIQTAAMDTKLAEDVDQVNTAISLYVTGGGRLEGLTNPQAVVDRLKTVTTTEDGNDREIMFAKRSMIDQRLAVVTNANSSQKGFWHWNRLHARYNSETRRFEVVAEAGNDTIRGFALDDVRGTDVIGTERRDVVFRQAKNDPWVWDFDPASTSAPTNLPTGVVGTDTTATVSPPAALTGALRAQPPSFDPEPASQPLNEYPLSVKLLNPNNALVSRILYHLEPGIGLDTDYKGPITVNPGTKVVAFVQSLDPTIYLDSEVATRTYLPDPVLPLLNDTLAPSYTYLEAGGTLAAGSPTPETPVPARITLANGGDIPNLYENDSGFRVYWTYDGSDPANSSTLTQGTSFFESYPGDIVPVRVSDFGDEPEMVVKYFAKAHNTNAFANSTITERTIGINKLTLPAPVLSTPANATIVSGPVSMYADVSTGVVPTDHRIFYTTDGDDPGNVNGEPAPHALAYTGPVGELMEGAIVVARVYPPADRRHWFNVSPPASLQIGTPIAALYYAVGENNQKIHVFDPNGANVVKTSTALFPIECIAADATNTRIYYLEHADAQWRLGLYNVQTGEHKNLGPLDQDYFFDRPVSQPTNLMYFNDGLYYIHENSDNLVKIELNGDEVAQQFRVADITGDAVAFTGIGDIVADANGRLILSSTNAFATYDLRKMADYKEIATNPANVWKGMVMAEGGYLLGVKADTPSVLHAVSLADGSASAPVAFSPVRSFTDFAGPQTRVLTEPVGGQHYFVTNGQATIHRLDMSTGRNYLLTTLLPMQPTGIAIDRTNSLIYTVGFDDSDRPGDAFLTRFDLTTGQITDLGSLKEASWAYRPVSHPVCLTYFQNKLYYVPTDTDDLVEIEFNATEITAQSKAADILDNAGDLGDVDALTIGPDGWLYISRSDADLLAKYEIAVRGNFTVVKGDLEASYQALTFDIYGLLHGTFASKPRQVWLTDESTGTAAFQFETQPNLAVWDITGMFDTTPPPITNDYFAVDGSSNRIFRLDPDTGWNQVFTYTPWVPDTIAFDTDRRRIYYLRRDQHTLGVYDIQGNSHSVLGQINNSSLNYIPSSRPYNLTCFNGALYYITPDTDDLVKIEIDPFGRMGQAYKVADLRDNAGSLDFVGDLAVDAGGLLHISSSTVFATFDMRTLDDYTVVAPTSTSTGRYAGLLFTVDGRLKGTRVDDSRIIHSVALATGGSTSAIPNVPFRGFGDLAGPQNRVPVDVPQGSYYFAQSSSSVIRELDIDSGANRILTWAAPWNLGGIAYDPETRIIYYSENPGSATETHIAKYEVELDRHTELGSLSASGLGYVPSAMPKHLAFFCGSLYYIAPNTDDLIKVAIDDRQILSAEKVADINANASLGDIGAVAVDNTGWLYLSRQSGSLLARFNLHTLNRYSVISTGSQANQQGLTFDTSNILHGFPVSAPATIHTLNATGALTVKAATAPSQAIWDITGNNSCPPPDIAGNYYGVTGGNRRIYKFDPATGVTGVMTNTAPFNLRALARDPDAGILYYLEDVTSGFRLGKYTLATNLHATLGTVDESNPNYRYRPALRPTNLFFYGGAIFYIASQTDDLVMITVDGSQITSQVKVADITNNTRTFDSVGDVAADTAGRAYASASDGTFFSFNMKTLGSFTVHGTGRPYYYGLLFTDTGAFHGVHGAQATSIQSVAAATGAATFASATTPAVSFLDFGGNEVSAPWERSDSLWALVSETSDHESAWSWNYSPTTPNGGVIGAAGAAWQGVSLRYDEGTRLLTGEITVDQTALAPSTGANHWQSVSFALGADSPPASGSTTGHAWVLLDYSTGQPRLGVYKYDVNYEGNRANPTTILNASQTAGSLQVTDTGTKRTFSFSLNVTPVQAASAAASWRGVEMTESIGATLRAWAQPAITYGSNQQITQWTPNKSGTDAAANHASLSATAVPAQGLSGRLVEFKNYRTPAIQATDWGLLYYRDGATLVPLATTSGLESLTISADGSAYFVKNGPTTIGGLTYQKPLFKLDIGSQSPGTALAATFVGDLQRGLIQLGAAANDQVTGLALSQSGLLHGVLRTGDSSATDRLFNVANLLRDSSNQLINVLPAGMLTGATHSVTAAEDISFSSNGTLHVTDAADGHIYSVDPATGTVLSLVSERSGAVYRALAINPSDNDLTVSDPASNTVRKVDAAASEDPAYFDYEARFDFSDVRALAFFNGLFAPVETTAPYYAASRTNRIHAVNPSTGATTLVTANTPFTVSSLALDAFGRHLYYTENDDGVIRLGRYTLASDTHVILGNLAATGYAYRPTRDIQNLVFFAGDLYYVHALSDDLVKVKVSATAITSQEKIADLNQDTSLGTVTAAALNDGGLLFLANSTSLYKYNLRTNSGFTTVTGALGSYDSLMWNSSGGSLHGASSSAITRVDSISPVDGTATPGVLTAPPLSLYDLTGPHSAVPLSGLANSLFAVTGGNRTIHVLNPQTGVNSVLDAGAPFTLRSIALDSDNGLLYYAEDTASTTSFGLGLYNLNTGTHTSLGNLRGSGAFAYTPSESPGNLAFYGGNLYYIPRNSDDLIKVTTSATAVTSQVKVLDIRGNTPFIEIGDLAISSGGFMYFGDRAPGAPMYRLSLAGLNDFQSFGFASRFFEATAVFEGSVYGSSSTGATTIERYIPNAGSLVAAGTVATAPVRSFVDMAGPAAAAMLGRSSSLWAIVETPQGHLVEIRNHRSALAAESVDYGEIFYLDGTTTRNLTSNSVKIQSLAITPAGRAFFTQNDTITFGGQNYARPLFYVDLPDLVLGTPTMAIFVGDMATGLAGGGSLGSSDNVTGLAAGPDGALYGVLNYNNSQALDKLFRLSSLRVNAAKSLTDITHVGNITGADFNSTSAEDIAFALDGTLQVADNTTDRVFTVDRATGAILGSYSYENNIQYLAMAVDPADGALLASHVSGSNEKVFRVVTPGTTPDTVLWDYRSRFGWTRTEAMAFYLRPFAGADGSLYAIGATGKSLYTISPLTGQTTVVTASSPAPGASLTSLAYNAPRHTLYYTDAADASGNFRLYRYDLAAETHTLIGQLNGGNFAYQVTQSPTNLACVNGELFFIHRQSDDLVRITLDGTAIASVQKVADLHNDASVFADVGDLSVRNDGILFLCANAKLWRYDLNTLTGLQQVSATSQDYRSLTFAAGNLVANRTASPSSLHLVNSQDGADSLLASTVPAINITDLASVEPDVALPNLSAAPYYGANRSRTIFTVDPVTAATTVLTSSAPFEIESLAHDKTANILYYVEDHNSTIRLGSYDLGSSSHAVLGDLKAGALTYRPTTRPENLVCFDGALYYIAPDTDDLVRIQITPTAIVSQERMTDLNNDLSFGMVRAATVDDAGYLYFNHGSNLARYDLRQGGGVDSLSSSFPTSLGLLWYPTEARLAAVSSATPTRLDAVAISDGQVTTGSPTTPAVSFSDLAGGNTAPAPPAAFYYGVNRTKVIYRVDPLTGVRSALPTGAAYNLDAIAYDETRRLLYVVENTNSNTRLGRYDLTSNTFVSMGNLRAGTWSHVPSERPQHLAFFAGDLYYINYHSSTTSLRDDLIRVRVSDTAILSQEKIMDLNGNTGLNRVTAASVDDAGMLYLAAGSQLKKFNLQELTGLDNLSTTAPVWSGLLWARADGFLYGTNSSTSNSRNQLSKIAATTGSTTYQADVNPQVSSGFYDLAGGNRAQPHSSLDVPRAYIGGEFATATGTHRNLARLASDGSLDPTFDPGTGANAPVRAVLRQDDGRVLAGGEFTQFNGQVRRGLVRVNPDGSTDTSFVPNIMATGSTSEINMDWAGWSSFIQNAPLSGADTWTGSRNAYYGLAGATGGVTGFGSQMWPNVNGSGVNLTLFYSQNMTEAGGTRNGQNDGPDRHGATSAATGGVNPDRRITGANALRFNSDRNGTITPVTVVASFSEPVYLNQAVWGSLQQIGGASTTYGANVVPNGSFETGPGWNNLGWFPSDLHANRAQARLDQAGSGIVSNWSIDGYHWVGDAGRATEGSRLIYLKPSDQSWNYCIGQEIGVGTTATSATPIIRHRNYRVMFDCVTFNPSLPDGVNASPMEPAVELQYRDTSNNSQFTELFNLQDTSTGLPPGDIPATNWNAPQWRTVTAHFTAPQTHSTNNKLQLWLSNKKKVGPVQEANYMADYNVIVFENLSSSSDLDGKIWVGGDLTGTSSFQMGDQYTPSGAENVVVVGGVIEGGAAANAINFGGGSKAKLAVKDLASRGLRPINWNGGGSQATRLVFDAGITSSFHTMRDDLTARSQAYRLLPANSTMITPSGQSNARRFVCNPATIQGQNGMSVFNINASDLFSNHAVAQVEITSATGNAADVQGVIINVAGTSANWSSNFNFVGSFTSNAWRQKVLWNFHEAATLACGSHQMNGAVLAPLAAVTSSNNFDGSLVCRSLTTTGECHRVPFTSHAVATLGLNMGTSGMLFDNVRIQEVTTSAGSFENAYFRAFSTPDATGTPLAADQYENLSLRSDPLLGTSADPVTVNLADNVRMDTNTGDNIYHTIGTGRQDENKHGRVSFSYTTQPVRSVAFTFWTTAATETLIGQVFPRFDGALTANPSAATLSVLGFSRANPPLGKVYAIAEQPDGKIVVGGDFGQVNGVATTNVARLNADGSLDPTFNPGQGSNGPVLALAVQPDGSVLAGGSFSSWNGQTSGNRLVKLTPNGARDTSFTPAFSSSAGDAVHWIGLDSAGRAVVGGKFSAPGNGIARLTGPGASDPAFTAGTGTGSGSVYAGLVTEGDKLFIGGDFSTVGGTARGRMARLHANGSLDTTWTPGTGFDGLVQAMVHLNGSEYIHTAGGFSTFQGTTRNKAAVAGALNGDAGRSPWGPAGLTISRIWSID